MEVREKKIPKHKKPIDPSPSKLLAKYAEEIAYNSNGTIVDVPCGYGRNAAYIASFGIPVLCIDINDDALEFIKTGINLTTAKLKDPNLLNTLKLDLINDPWPFKGESIGAIINVHFFNPRIVELFVNSLKKGGYLLIETIDGQGGNYLELPAYGFIKNKLMNVFDFRYFIEKQVGHSYNNASTVKVLAIKRKIKI